MADAVLSVENTTWQWSKGKTVTFLPGGQVSFCDSTYGGRWKQDGNSIKFDSNGFTLFEVLITDDEMTGTWRHLQESDGREYYTDLQRVR